jgi:hypothetical protein
MRTYNLVLIVIGTLVIAVKGLLAVTAAIYPPVFLLLGDLISGPLTYTAEGTLARLITGVTGLLLLGACVIAVVGNVRANRRARTVVLQNPLGEVLVSLPAIEDFARVLKGKIEGLKDIKGRVVFTRKGLRVSARVTVLSDYSISEVTQKTQDAIRNYIQNTLGIEQEINPTVVVSKVVAREKPVSVGGHRNLYGNAGPLGPTPLR